MSDARAEILERIRLALADAPPATPVPREYRRGDSRPREELVERFLTRVRDYAAEAERVDPARVGAAVTAACRRMGLDRLLVAPGVTGDWLPEGIETITDDGAAPAALDAIGAALTGCATAIAETGTVVLDGRPPCGRRALTLVPDHHLCVVRAEQIVGQVPEALAAVPDAVAGRRTPITLVSGSSATSDIELERVEGVHGPRRLLVIVAG